MQDLITVLRDSQVSLEAKLEHISQALISQGRAPVRRAALYVINNPQEFEKKLISFTFMLFRKWSLPEDKKLFEQMAEHSADEEIAALARMVIDDVVHKRVEEIKAKPGRSGS